ncbi:hypothetical protein K491DRAFT_698082 [Lophiostoma macrostomum CBS 122681]|uniref:WW domain-containing protein n=1 Tax=Lophiostoma macrostomum CBS 122681 TaxID=1314788 RepID=A0A6A6SR49_9PLEO|nr:hypothetical protein K491DRAFT_698082 [Lophiostoma macrostomum CBS 122681]
MDPLSVTASIVGILAAAGKVIEVIGPLVGALKDTAKTAATIHAEVNSSRIILSALQRLLADLGSTQVKRKELIQVDQLIATLTDGVLIFNELEPLVVQLGSSTENLRARVRWALKRDPLESFVSRMQLFRGSISVMLNILQCESDLEAARSQEDLYILTSSLIQSNQDISQRLSLLERPRQDNASIMTGHRRPFSTATLESSMQDLTFERDLKGSWVYRKVRRSTTEDKSFRSSVALSHAWSALSEISLSDISAISVVALPISCNDLVNGYHYRSRDQLELSTLARIYSSHLQKNPVSNASIPTSTALEKTDLPQSLSSQMSDQNHTEVPDTRSPSHGEKHELEKMEEDKFWIPQATSDGKLYYYNTLTRVSLEGIPFETPSRLASPSLPLPKPQEIGQDIHSESLARAVPRRRYRIAVFGSHEVDKSAFVLQFVGAGEYAAGEDGFSRNFSKDCVVDGEAAIIDIVDSTGLEDYFAMREQYMWDAEAFIILYNIHNRQSFKETNVYHQQFLRVKHRHTFPMILVGNLVNSLDLRQVSTDEGRALANELDCHFLEASTKTKVNVELTFHELVRVRRRYETQEKMLFEEYVRFTKSPIHPLRKVNGFETWRFKNLTEVQRRRIVGHVNRSWRQ